MTQAHRLEGIEVEGERPVLVGDQFEEQCLLHAETAFPLFIQSPPGAGKTQKGKGLVRSRGQELAEIMGYENAKDVPIAVIPAQQAEMENITGFVFLDRKSDGKAEPGWLFPPFYSDQPMIVIVDEVNRAKEPTRSALFPALTGDPMINGFQFHPRTLWILLGNGTDHQAGVRELDRALKGRMSHYDFLPLTEDWMTNFAGPEGVDPRVVGFLKANPDYLCYFDPNSKGDAQPSPRTWDRGVSRAWSSRRRSMDARKRSVIASIGSFVGEQFIAYAEGYELLPDPAVLASDPASVVIPKEMDAIFMVAQSLGQHLAQPITVGTTAVAIGAAQVLGRMAAGGLLEPVVLAARNAMRRMTETGQPVCLALPQVQAVLKNFPEIQDFLIHLGRAQMGGLQ